MHDLSKPPPEKREIIIKTNFNERKGSIKDNSILSGKNIFVATIITLLFSIFPIYKHLNLVESCKVEKTTLVKKLQNNESNSNIDYLLTEFITECGSILK